jgi:hypothetical protein
MTSQIIVFQPSQNVFLYQPMILLAFDYHSRELLICVVRSRRFPYLCRYAWLFVSIKVPDLWVMLVFVAGEELVPHRGVHLQVGRFPASGHQPSGQLGCLLYAPGSLVFCSSSCRLVICLQLFSSPLCSPSAHVLSTVDHVFLGQERRLLAILATRLLTCLISSSAILVNSRV